MVLVYMAHGNEKRVLFVSYYIAKKILDT